MLCTCNCSLEYSVKQGKVVFIRNMNTLLYICAAELVVKSLVMRRVNSLCDVSQKLYMRLS